MAKTLVIVESPAKAKTIEKFLGKSHYTVKASVGHVRDLPKSKLGVDIENNFEPQYINIRGKGDLIKELKKEAKKSKKVYLATDPDREGEAISWHLAYILGLDQNDECRIEFNEITKDAIKKAIEEAKKNLVEVPIVGTTVPHEYVGKFGSANVMLKPAEEGTGVIAGGSVRPILELAGYKDIRTKVIGTNNPRNVVYATLAGLKSMRTAEQIAKKRGKTVSEIL